MKINYELTLNDCKAYAKEVFFIKRIFCCFIKENVLKAIICSILLSPSLGLLFFGFHIIPVITLFIGLFIFVYIIWGLMWYYSGGKNVYRMLEGFDKNYELIIEEDIIKRISSSGESLFNWKNVKDIYNTKRNILIFVSDRQAIIIPKRIFESEQELNEFWNEVQNKYKSVTKE